MLIAPLARAAAVAAAAGVRPLRPPLPAASFRDC